MIFVGALAGMPAEAQTSDIANPPAPAGPNAPLATNPPPSPSANQGSGDIIVTAQKRSERKQDVPVPVTALDASDLTRTGKNRIQDYFATVPGLDFSSFGGNGEQNIAIRGIITTSVSNPTVGTVVDDVPVGSNSYAGMGSLLAPELSPSEISQIEVLRGPQGTLYGASSIGGLIKYVTVDPSTRAISGQISAGGSFIAGGGGGYNVNGALNLPVTDTVAFRISGFGRRDPGFVDNRTTGEHDVNWVDVRGGRAALLWRPVENITVKLSALYQETKGKDNGYIDTDAQLNPVYGDSHSESPRSGRYSKHIQLYTAAIDVDLGPVTLTSITSRGIYKYSAASDFSYVYGQFAQPIFGVGGAVEEDRYDTKKLTQEIRLSSNHGGKFDWLAGLFYNDEKTPLLSTVYAYDLATAIDVGKLAGYVDRSKLREYAGFGDLTVHFGTRFDIQLGGRYSRMKQSLGEIDSGPLSSPDPLVLPVGRTNDHALTYLVTPRFRFSNDVMVYARLASGYRVGGINTGAVLYDNPPTFAPDKTYNYEIGTKGSLFDNHLSFDASLYYIDWKNIQIQLYNPGTLGFYTDNAAGAHSKGFELTLDGRPLRGLTLTGTLSLSDAVLSKDFPADITSSYGFKGDRLPYSSKVSASFSAKQDIPLGHGVIANIGGTFTYTGPRFGEFQLNTEPSRFRFPVLRQLDLDAGIRYRGWSLDVYLNNVADAGDPIGGGVAQTVTGHYIVSQQPRTFGLIATATF